MNDLTLKGLSRMETDRQTLAFTLGGLLGGPALYEDFARVTAQGGEGVGDLLQPSCARSQEDISPPGE